MRSSGFPRKSCLWSTIRRSYSSRFWKTPKRGISLYLSIPFCPTRCSYCSFVSHSIEQAHKLIPGYLEKLCEELVIWGQLVREQELLVDTVYFGGGTPTSLTAEQLEQVLTAVQDNFDLSHLREYCVEAGRPDTITPEKLKTLKRFGVDRISVNPQTMQDSVLETIGRKHTTAQTVEAFRMARAAGFDNINMDLIAGLPGDTPEGFHDTLEQIMALDPDSITVHALTLKRAANLFAEGESQVHNPVEQMVQESMRRLPEHGYAPYYMYRQKNTIDNQENVGYARAGKESLYNILIMDESQSIFGAGCGASTKLVEPCGRITRIHNYKFPYEYIRQFDQLMQKKEQVREICERIREQETE
ncbi:MAG: coproporphyrinogen dehydrogenase HemZ [Ruminococcus sp.]